MSDYRVPILDYSRETSVFSVPTDDGTPPSAADMTALYTNLANMTIGTRGDGTLHETTVNDAGSTATPASPYAQREAKYVVSFTSDVTGNRYSREIPAPDLTLMAAGQQFLDLANATVAAFVAAFEAIARVQEGAAFNAVTVTSIKHVGRNT